MSLDEEIDRGIAMLEAFRKGETLQYQHHSGEWEDVMTKTFPLFTLSKFRIKPSMLGYRRYMGYRKDQYFIRTIYKNQKDDYSTNLDFIKWIDEDWQEVEIPQG